MMPTFFCLHWLHHYHLRFFCGRWACWSRHLMHDGLVVAPITNGNILVLASCLGLCWYLDYSLLISNPIPCSVNHWPKLNMAKKGSLLRNTRQVIHIYSMLLHLSLDHAFFYLRRLVLLSSIASAITSASSPIDFSGKNLSLPNPTMKIPFSLSSRAITQSFL